MISVEMMFTHLKKIETILKSAKRRGKKSPTAQKELSLIYVASTVMANPHINSAKQGWLWCHMSVIQALIRKPETMGLP